MSYETLKRVMAALAGVAEAVGTLRALLPAGSDRADAVSQAVCELTDGLLEDAMLGEVGSPERTGPTPAAPEKAVKPARPRLTALGRAAKKAANERLDRIPEPGEGDETARMRYNPTGHAPARSAAEGR